ncbi:MAG TPA: hypothetical protein VEO74_05065 [Thermoanaerobaculia bacterium]|nr:hypothetical protein [Thermoanaerobaculia bacterium]
MSFHETGIAFPIPVLDDGELAAVRAGAPLVRRTPPPKSSETKEIA